MSACENIDGQCAASWCDCDYQRRKMRSFAGPHGSAALQQTPDWSSLAVAYLRTAANFVEMGQLKQAYMEAENAQRCLKDAIADAQPNDQGQARPDRLNL